ncbi:unnamed protein product [Psylliodes chrysocephalus]|uniref:Uncharacterized protein n=1 Tax=Psylliodes chrysocephalus TaxID=3402493 RepID=A0A9P0GBU9_9CUCU|nr:unnamed protein product [Psylliodes chrysocephala]
MLTNLFLFKKAKPKRRRHKGNRRASVTDVEDLDVSDDDSRFAFYVKPKRKSQSEIAIKQHVSPYESDNEDNFRIPFPICKKVAWKKQNIFNIPEFDTNFPSDIEDFDDISENLRNGKAQCFKSDAIFNNADTDSDICQTETSDKENEDEEEDIVHYDIKFKTTLTVETKIKSKSNLLLQVVKDEESDYRMRECRWLRLRKDIGNDTDDSNNTQKIELPPPVRNLIILKDNETFPTIQILPLTDESLIQSSEESMNIETDKESVSEGSEAVDGIMPISISNFNLLDCGIINESEQVQKQSKKLQVSIKDHENDLTDTEELVMSERRCRPPKFK